MRIVTFLVGLLFLTVTATPAIATHGERAIGLVHLDGGREITVLMLYAREALGQQVWEFRFIEQDQDPLNCNGYGTLEKGFVNGLTCPIAWRTGGTGDSHPYPYHDVDQHTVSIQFDGINGTMNQTVLPDVGA